MAAITAAMVKELREMTGAGMMDCKKALNETNGDMEAAVEVLKKSGAAKMEKKNSKKKVVDSKNVNSMATKYTKKIEEMKQQVYEDAEKQQESIPVICGRRLDHCPCPAGAAGDDRSCRTPVCLCGHGLCQVRRIPGLFRV